MRNERLTGPDPIDALIDGAARQMMAGEPSASLRRSVRHRIGDRRLPWLWSPVLAGAAVAVVIAFVLVGRAMLLDPVGRTLSGPAGQRDNVPPTIERAAVAVQPPVVESDSVPQTPIRMTRRLADDVAGAPQEEEPLIPPIAIELLQPDQIAVGNPIAVESSGVMPIEIEPLQLEPLRGIE